MRLQNSTKVFILIQLLDLLTTIVGIHCFGLSEGNLLYSGWATERLISLKLIYTVMIAIILEMPFDFGLFSWVPAIISFPPVPWNIYLIWTVL